MDKRLLQEAETHFREHGDSIQFKSGGNPNASYDVVRGDLSVYAYGRTKDWMDAEDAVMEAYVRMLETEVEVENFSGLFKITLDHTVVDQQRKDNVREHINVDEEVVIGRDDDVRQESLVAKAESLEADPLQLLEVQEKIDWIMEKSNNMSIKAKGIIRMTYIFGYTPIEIGKLLNIKPKKVSNTLLYFKKQLEEWEDDTE
jgi:RNA polymerase sigma factor (sigma-70 family)